jgi:hypothetical protein
MISESDMISHLLSFDDVFCCVYRLLRDVSVLKGIIDILCRVIGMLINLEKSCMCFNNCYEAEANSFLSVIPTQRKNLVESFKYLSFYLKLDGYKKVDWGWLICKVEARIYVWMNKFISRGGKMVLIKSIPKRIPFYSNYIVAIPKGFLDKLRRISFKYLWSS